MTTNVLNSTYNIDAITHALMDIKASSHYNLLTYQRNNIGIDRVDIGLEKFRLVRDTSTGSIREFQEIHINYDLVLTRNHIRYKNSKLNKKVITIQDIDDNKNIFNKIPVVFLRGKFIDFAKFRVMRNELVIIIDVLDYKIDLKNEPGELVLLFVPNNDYNPYHSEYSVVKRYKDQLSQYYINDYSIDLDNDSVYASSIRDGSFYFKSMIRTEDPSIKLGLAYASNGNKDRDNKHMYLNLASLKSYIARLNVIQANGHNYVEVPEMKMPIPKENIVPLNRHDDGSFTLNGDIGFGESYHGIYELTNLAQDEEIDEIYCLIFYTYERDELGDADGYERHTDLYKKVMNIDASNIDTFANALYRNYNVDKIEYGTLDYYDKNNNDNIKYRVEELRKVIEKYPMMYNKYLQLLVDSVDGYYIDVSAIDYDSKIRYSTVNEAIDGVPETLRNFVNERLLIIFKNDDRNATKIRLYIDGVLYLPDFIIEKGIYDFYYIPTSVVKRDSIIEVERFRFNLVRTEHVVPDMDTVIISPNVNKGRQVKDMARISDIYLSVKTSGKYLHENDFDIYYKDTLMDPNSNVIIDDNVIIRLNNEKYLNSTLVLSIGRVSFLKELSIKNDDSMDEYIRFKLPMKPNKKLMRFYRNYRLINPDLYHMTGSENSTSYSYGFSGIRDVVGDVFTVDYTSIKYEVELSIDVIPEHGLLDLRGKLDRPLSFKWYDFYLNGKRLNPKTAEILSPYLMRINKSVGTLKNFFIVSRDSDQEFLSIRNNKTIIETLLDADAEFERRLKDNLIEDEEPDIITEIIDGIDFELPNVFLDVLYPIELINPRIEQIDDKHFNTYAKYYERDASTMVLGKVNNGVNDAILVNPGEEKKEYDISTEVNI